MADEKCANCKFYKDTFCKRYPPIDKAVRVWPEDHSYEIKSRATFPVVKEDEWCGEWRKP